MKKPVKMILLACIAVLFVIGMLGIANILPIYGAFSSPILILSALMNTGALVGSSRGKTILIHLSQVLLVLLAGVGIFFMFVPTPRKVDAVLSLIGAILILATAILPQRPFHRRDA